MEAPLDKLVDANGENLAESSDKSSRSNAQQLGMKSNDSPQLTSETFVGYNASATNSIPNQAKNINTNYSGGTEAYSGTAGRVSDGTNWVAQKQNDTVQGNEAVASLEEVVRDLESSFGIAISKGKTSPKALGTFNRKSESVRSKSMTDIETISHEVGHYFDRKYGLRANKAAMAEAVSVFKRLEPAFSSAYDDSKLPGEAVAEYMRMRMRRRHKTSRFLTAL